MAMIARLRTKVLNVQIGKMMYREFIRGTGRSWKLDSGRVCALRPESPAMSLKGPAEVRWREGKPEVDLSAN